MECPSTFQRYRALQGLFIFSWRAAQQEPVRRSSAWNFRAVKFTGEIKYRKTIKTIKTARPINPEHKIWRGSKTFLNLFPNSSFSQTPFWKACFDHNKSDCLNRRKPG